MEFGTKLKELRQLRDISLRKLGEKAGISYSILNSIENGRIQPSREIVASLAYALKVENSTELLALAGYDSVAGKGADER
ncbi:helix-turn-helix domain-containing protein [Paenibacillus agricola]|uniref:Helix-turn-helix transcriptional regulator n=1 Tax=Paenibacillus agricola TaxID=2716264 RepID=A0ABX0JBH4_9BACL|nr:helix-turn-helix transcriptional regulator [Paenibacillus agricola]NHN32898.1 helix-turn-helix transcriptional regulator [Paenibacillus agricola]